jgi:hypothetical protein
VLLALIPSKTVPQRARPRASKPSAGASSIIVPRLETASGFSRGISSSVQVQSEVFAPDLFCSRGRKLACGLRPPQGRLSRAPALRPTQGPGSQTRTPCRRAPSAGRQLPSRLLAPPALPLTRHGALHLAAAARLQGSSLGSQRAFPHEPPPSPRRLLHRATVSGVPRRRSRAAADGATHCRCRRRRRRQPRHRAAPTGREAVGRRGWERNRCGWERRGLARDSGATGSGAV